MASGVTCVTGVEYSAYDEPKSEILAPFDATERDFMHAVHLVEKRCLVRLNVNVPLVHTGHSTVYRAYSQLYRRYVAIKILHKNAIPEFVAEKFLPRELEVTALAHHPHLCTCLEIYEANETKMIIISEFYPNGTLMHLVQKIGGGIPEANTARMFRQMVEALNYLHSHNVVHRDIKLQNILLDEKYDVKLADFGFSRFITRAEKSTSFCGSRPFCSPNIIREKPYDAFAADWFAMGVALYTMLTGVYPEDEVNTKTHEYISLTFPKPVPVLAGRLIQSLVCEDESRRAGYEECVSSEWLRMHTNGKWIMADPYFIYEIISP